MKNFSKNEVEEEPLDFRYIHRDLLGVALTERIPLPMIIHELEIWALAVNGCNMERLPQSLHRRGSNADLGGLVTVLIFLCRLLMMIGELRAWNNLKDGCH